MNTSTVINPKTDIPELPTKPFTISEAIDNRNVIDQFKGINTDIIIGEQMKRRIPLITIALNISGDLNKATCLRTHSGVSGKSFYFLNRPNDQIDSPEGSKHYNRRGTVGTHIYNTVHHYDINRYKELFAELRADGYTIIAVDNIQGYDAKLVYDVELPERTAFIMGEEGLGVPIEIIEAADFMTFLPMNGVAPRSYNVSTAHGGVVFEYMRQNRHLIR